MALVPWPRELTTTQRLRHASCAGRGEREPPGDAHGQIGKGLRLDHIAIQPCIFDRADDCTAAGGKSRHHDRVLAPAARDIKDRWRAWAMVKPAGDREGRRLCQCHGGICIAERGAIRQQPPERVAVQ